jgi:hypothetical protein
MSPPLIMQFRDHAAALSASILALEQSLPTPNTIQQAELMLQVTARQLKRLANQQRLHLLSRLDLLAAVQPGEFDVWIQSQRCRRFVSE